MQKDTIIEDIDNFNNKNKFKNNRKIVAKIKRFL